MPRPIATALLCLLASLPATAPAAANGPHPFSWTGLYIGAHAGHGWADWDGRMAYSDATPGDGFDSGGKTIGGDGLNGGLQAGFNVQTGSVVWGLEADVSWMDADGEATLLPYPNSAGSPAWKFRTELDVLGTVRGRVGVTSGPLLIYATGGVAFARATTHLDVLGPGYNAWARSEENLIGWAAGGGLEWAFAPHWSLKAEYLYVDLGDTGSNMAGIQKTSCPAGCPHTTDSFPADLDLHIVRAGINYRF